MMPALFFNAGIFQSYLRVTNTIAADRRNPPAPPYFTGRKRRSRESIEPT